MISISLLLFQKLEKKLKKRNDFCYNVIIIKGDGNMDNNQLSNNNQEMNHQVTPIQEVNVESSVNNSNTFSNLETNTTNITTNVDTNNNSQQPSNTPPKNNKISTILLIILFIFLFAFVMGMPYIKEFIHDFKADKGLSEIEKAAKEEEEKQRQEEESKKPTPTPEDEKTTELTCTSAPTTIENYSLTKIQTFYYNAKKQVLNSKMVSEYTFTTADSTYLTLKNQCDSDSLKYVTHEGYTMACSYGDTNITISHEFDLKTYTPIIDGTTNIQANAKYNQDINSIKSDLVSKGYTCTQAR